MELGTLIFFNMISTHENDRFFCSPQSFLFHHVPRGGLAPLSESPELLPRRPRRLLPVPSREPRPAPGGHLYRVVDRPPGARHGPSRPIVHVGVLSRAEAPKVNRQEKLVTVRPSAALGVGDVAARHQARGAQGSRQG